MALISPPPPPPPLPPLSLLSLSFFLTVVSLEIVILRSGGASYACIKSLLPPEGILSDMRLALSLIEGLIRGAAHELVARTVMFKRAEDNPPTGASVCIGHTYGSFRDIEWPAIIKTNRSRH